MRSHAASVVASYRDALTDTATLKHKGADGWASYRGIPARVTAYAPEVIAGSLQQGDTQVIALKDALDKLSFPGLPASGDRVTTSDGRTLTVQACDPNTRRVDGVTIAYVLQCRG